MSEDIQIQDNEDIDVIVVDDNEVIDNVALEAILKGDKGDTGEKGEDGKDYVITQEDYQEIANIVESQIEIPSKYSDLINDNNTVQDADYVHTDNNFNNTYKDNVDSNTSARHTHANKVVLDGISANDISNWNNSVIIYSNDSDAVKIEKFMSCVNENNELVKEPIYVNTTTEENFPKGIYRFLNNVGYNYTSGEYIFGYYTMGEAGFLDYYICFVIYSNQIHKYKYNIDVESYIQHKLISGENIKTVDNQSLLGQGNINTKQIYKGPDEPTDPNILIWIDTSEEPVVKGRLLTSDEEPFITVDGQNFLVAQNGEETESIPINTNAIEENEVLDIEDYISKYTGLQIDAGLDLAYTAVQQEDLSGYQLLITVSNKLSSDLVDDTNATNKFVTTNDISNWNNKVDKNVNNLVNYTLKTNTGSLIDLEINQTTYVVTLSLKDQDGNVISTDTIDLPLENVVVSGSYDSVNEKIVLTLQSGDTVDIPVGALVAGLQAEITSSNKLASDLVDDTNSGHKFVTTSEKQTWNGKYEKPNGGIPKADLSSTVQNSLDKADNSVQQETGKGLSTNDYTTAEKTKLAGIEAEANKTIVDDELSSISENPVQNKVITANIEDIIERDMRILKNTPTGTTNTNPVTINDSADLPLNKFSLVGKSEQGENPSPSNLQEIINVEGIIQIKKYNKNSLSISNGTYSNNGITVEVNNGELTLNGTANGNAIIYIPFAYSFKAQAYTLSFNNPVASTAVILRFDSNVMPETAGIINRTYSYTFSEITNVSNFVVRVANGNTVTNFKLKPMLEEGTTATDYIEHAEKTYNFPLSEGQKLYEGSYLAEDGIHHVRGHVVLDGTEIGINTDGATTNYRRFTIPKAVFNNISNTAISDYFKYKENYNLDEPHFYIGSSVYFFALNSTATVTDFRNWLSTHNTTVEYELATEEIIPYTEEQKAVIDEIINDGTYKEVTHYEATANINPDMEVTYYKDLEKLINNIESRLSLLE